MSLNIGQIIGATPKDLTRTVRNHAADSLKNIPDGLFDFLREKLPELRELSDSSFAVLIILKDEGKLNKVNVQKTLNKGRVSTDDRLTDKVIRLLYPLMVDFRQGGKGSIVLLDSLQALKPTSQIGSISITTQLSDEEKAIKMLDRLIEEYSTDPKEEGKDTLAQMQAFKKYFVSPVTKTKEKIQLVVPNTHDLTSTTSFPYAPAAFYLNEITDKETGNVFQEAFPVLQKDFVQEHWGSFDDKLVRINFAASIVKEGTYFLTLESFPDLMKSGDLLEKKFFEEFKKIKLKSQDTADEQYARLAANKEVVEAAKRYIVAKVHLEYIGFKSKIEFFGRQIEGITINPGSIPYLKPTVAHHLIVNAEKSSHLNNKHEIDNESAYKLEMVEELHKITQDTSITHVAFRVILKDHELQKRTDSPFAFVNDRQYFTDK